MDKDLWAKRIILTDLLLIIFGVGHTFLPSDIQPDFVADVAHGVADVIIIGNMYFLSKTHKT